jgi:DNA-binding winged helix-turn-helix (wHTH) protein
MLWADGNRVDLTAREFLIAWVFFSSPGVLLARETLGMSVWGAHSDVASRTIEQHIYTLRKKLAMGVARGVWIRTAYARGYRLEIDPHRLARAESAIACDFDDPYSPRRAPSAGIEQVLKPADAARLVS